MLHRVSKKTLASYYHNQMLYLYFLNSTNQQGQPSWTFCTLGQWFWPNCNADRPYNSEHTILVVSVQAY